MWTDPTPEQLGFDAAYMEQVRKRNLLLDINTIPWMDVSNETFGLDGYDEANYEYVKDENKKPFDLEDFLANCRTPTPEELGFKDDENFKPRKPFNLEEVLNFPEPTPEELGFGKWDEVEEQESRLPSVPKQDKPKNNRNPFSISNSISMIEDPALRKTTNDVFYKLNSSTISIDNVDNRQYQTHEEPFFNPNMSPPE